MNYSKNQYNIQYKIEKVFALDYITAISLVNRYCDILPSERRRRAMSAKHGHRLMRKQYSGDHMLF